MHDESQGPGWWQASDGKWYAPEQHPDPGHRARYASPPPADAMPADAVPADGRPLDQAPPVGPGPSTDPRATVGPGGFTVPGGAGAPPGPATPGPTATSPEYGAPPSAPPAYGAAPPSGIPASFGASTPTGAAPGVPAPFAAGGQPARLTVDRAPTIARWRVFAHPFMLIPHAIVNYLLSAIANIVLLLSWFVILFTGKLPKGFHDFQTMVLRYTNRMAGFAVLLTEEYPPFEFTASADDRTAYPIRTDVAYVEEHNRVTTFFRLFLLIPHAVVLAFVVIGAYFAYIVGWFAVLFTGRLPEGIANFLVGVGRWATRVNAYGRLLTDVYPPFSLD